MNLGDQLNGILIDLQGVSTESSLILGSIVLLVAGLIRSNVWLIKGIFLAILSIALYFNLGNEVAGLFMMDSLKHSGLILSFNSLFILSGMLLVLFVRDDDHAPEFYFFILAMLVGSLFMTKSNNLLITYLAIELTSFASYILTNFSFKQKGFEAGIKYLLFGAISSAIMLFGIGLIYGSTGTIYFSNWTNLEFSEVLPQIGFVMLLIGIFFKISIVPAHIWVPATYQEAPTDATAFMSIVPKLGGMVLLMNLFRLDIFPESHWIYLLVYALGIVTILAGTLGALKQQHARRMIGFGAIAHSGFLLPLILMDSSTASNAFWYYGVAYALMNLAVFYLLDNYERNGVSSLNDYKGITANQWVGGSFTLVLVSMVGLPPLAGFTAKLLLFTSLWEGYQLLEQNHLLWYLIVAVLATVGSLFFYLQIPRQLFLNQLAEAKSIEFPNSTKFIATLFCIVLLLLFFVPQLVTEAQHMLNNLHE